MANLSAPLPPRTEPPSFREARDLLLTLDDRYMAARTQVVWPRPERFNWALDWFDADLATGDMVAKTALKVVGDTVEVRSFGELARESSGSPTVCAGSGLSAATGS